MIPAEVRTLVAFESDRRPGFATDGSVPRLVYLAAGVAYPFWHLLAPSDAIDPWWVWWGIAGCFCMAALLPARLRSQRLFGAHLLAACTALVTLHLFVLASIDHMRPFYAVGSALAVVTASFSIRDQRVLLGYGGLVAVAGAVSYAVAPDPRKIAYWGGMLPVVAFAYQRLSTQLAAAKTSRRQRRELERRVEERTRDLEEANRRLRREIQERTRLEGQLRLGQTMEVVGQLAGGVAHEFNNLLTTMRLYTELIQDQLPNESPLHSELRRIQKAGREAASLTQQLLDLSRDGRSEPDVLDLNELIRGSESMLRRLAGTAVELVCRLGDEDLRIWADRGEVERVLVNLVMNARDAMPRGGRIAIETGAMQRDELRGRGHVIDAEERDWVQLKVSDTGTGMDAETQGRIFDPFFTKKPVGKGSGLGLSIVYRIVREARGSIRLVSEPSKGASFELVWPRAERTARAREEGRQTISASRGNERILVVEDEADVREALGRVLRARGYEVLEAGDGAGALQRLREVGGAVDLLASDVVMPGMSGVELVERVAEEWPEIRALLLSAYADHPSLHGRPLPRGVPLLQKPFETADLMARVRELLDARSSRPA